MAQISNGQEGRAFEAAWCSRCRREPDCHNLARAYIGENVPAWTSPGPPFLVWKPVECMDFHPAIDGDVPHLPDGYSDPVLTVFSEVFRQRLEALQ